MFFFVDDVIPPVLCCSCSVGWNMLPAQARELVPVLLHNLAESILAIFSGDFFVGVLLFCLLPVATAVSRIAVSPFRNHNSTWKPGGTVMVRPRGLA